MSLGRTKHLPRSAFVGLCAFMLTASMALPFASTPKSYAEENEASPQGSSESFIQSIESKGEETAQEVTSSSDGKEMSVVSFADWYPSVEVETGQTIAEPTPLSDRTITYRGKERPVVFKGWIEEWYITPDETQKLCCYQGSIDIFDKLKDFSEPITDPTVNFYPVFECPEYLFTIDLNLPDGSGHGTSIHVLPNDTVASVTSSNPDYYYQFFQTLGGASEQTVEPGTEPSFLPGYTFLGWFDQEGNQFDSDTPILRDTVLTTKFERNGNPIPSENKDIPVSGSTGIVANGTMQGENVPTGASIWLSASNAASNDANNALVAQMGEGVYGGVFEVNLMINGKQVHDGFGSLTLSFPVDAKYNDHWVTVWHRHNDGSITSEKVIAKNSLATITVTDLSTFALEIGELAGGASDSDGAITPVALDTSNGTALAQTGDPAPVFAIIGIALAAFAVIAFAGLRSRKPAGK